MFTATLIYITKHSDHSRCVYIERLQSLQVSLLVSEGRSCHFHAQHPHCVNTKCTCAHLCIPVGLKMRCGQRHWWWIAILRRQKATVPYTDKKLVQSQRRSPCHGVIITKVQELDHATPPRWSATQAQPIQPPRLISITTRISSKHVCLISSTTCSPWFNHPWNLYRQA